MAPKRKLLKHKRDSRIIVEDPVDSDSCPHDGILQQFVSKSIASEALTKKSAYVMNLASDCSFGKIAASTSTNVVQVFQTAEAELTKINKFKISKNEKNSMCGVEFSKIDENALYVGTKEGRIHLFDLRKSDSVCTYTDKASDAKIPFSSFSVNANGRILCAGTEQIAKDVFLYFFDTRRRKLLGKYSDSHNREVTTLEFHPENPDFLASGSIDGLINIFDVSLDCEDDALENVLNTESSVHKIQWHKTVKNKWTISCVTHTNDFQLFEVEDADLLSKFSRFDITDAIRRKSEDFCNLINCHRIENGGIFLVAGSNYEEDTVLRSVKMAGVGLKPLANYEGNSQFIRDSVYDAKNDILITGGENGKISLWQTKA